MRLRKFPHSCVRLEKDDKVVVVDPGVYSDAAQALEGADAILITHEHPDHYDAEAVKAAILHGVEVYAPTELAVALHDQAPESSERVYGIAPGESFEVAGFQVQSVGGQHALIHPLVPIVQNLGYLFDGKLYHPGDALIVPAGVTVETLLLPIQAPWSKSAEVIDFLCSVRPAKAYQIHEALLSEIGLNIIQGHLQRFGAQYGTEYRHLAVGEEVAV